MVDHDIAWMDSELHSKSLQSMQQGKETQEINAWGKLNRQGHAHSLTGHMLDVAACFYAVVQVRAVRRGMERAARRSLTDLDLMRLTVLAFLHDVGKANAGFQAKRWSHTGQPAPHGWPAPAGHTSEALFIFGKEALLNQFPVDEMSQWGHACMSLWRASISHHGRPVEDIIDSRSALLLWSPVQNAGKVVYHPQATLGEMGQCLKKWFPSALEVGPELPDSPEFAHLFAGLVQFADWLGSDTRFFPYAEPGEDRNQWVWTKAQEAVATIGFDVSTWRQSLPKELCFPAIFKVQEPRPIQAKMGSNELGPLLILESETGSGKTEAALWRFAQLFQAGQVDGLYFALPTRVAASQLYERTRQFARNMWQGTGQEPPMVVRALAGYESADGQSVQKLPNFEVLWADKPDEQKAHSRWAAESSKRFLAAPLAVGTIDQALLGALQVRHAHMRHSLLSRSLLVVDEVHASDAYMATLLAHLLKAHLNAGGHALLLSATLGSSARHRYQRLISPNVPMPTLAQAIELPYPALTDGAEMDGLPDAGRSKRVHWQVKDCIDNADAIAELAIHSAKQGAKVLVIRNTVPTALATFRAIENLAQQNDLQKALFNLNGIATVHHSRYSREDRPQLDKAVEQQIGKERAEPLQACIVVGTQTLEQSLDIDADLLITDLCPMDVLLQRVGRLHRHDRLPDERPENYRQAQAVVLVPTGGSLEGCLTKSRHGLGRFNQGGGIYIDLRILEATRRLISGAESHLIPQDNRALVERATHPEVLAGLEKELGVDWAKHGLDVLGDGLAATVQGKHNVLDFKKHFWEIDDSGYEVDAYRFTGTEQHISSRLGAGDYLLSFDPPQRSPFGIELRKIPVRPRLWPNELPPDTLPIVQATATDGSFTFTLGTSAYRYSRLGLERITDNANGDSL
jgi:CRISPR-associated endonuclease/helicase Cas3